MILVKNLEAVHAILNMATYRGLNDAMVAHGEPTLQRTRGYYSETVVDGNGQSIFKRRTLSGRNISVKTIARQTLHATSSSASYSWEAEGEKMGLGVATWLPVLVLWFRFWAVDIFGFIKNICDSAAKYWLDSVLTPYYMLNSLVNNAKKHFWEVFVPL